jgi:hypothetical protein
VDSRTARNIGPGAADQMSLLISGNLRFRIQSLSTPFPNSLTIAKGDLYWVTLDSIARVFRLTGLPSHKENGEAYWRLAGRENGSRLLDIWSDAVQYAESGRLGRNGKRCADGRLRFI